jgi:DNA-binding transcriptional LysR family regulator
MDPIDTRELRYFLAVAEERHFTRAATKLHIAQPALSKAVRRLEERLGVTLFVRTSRAVRLTRSGEVLADHGRHALMALDAAVEATRRADRHENLRLVIKPGGDANLLSGILAAFADDPAARQVDIVFSRETARSAYLHDGRADAALLYVPFDDLAGLHAQTLRVEERVAVLASDHPLASRDGIRLADLAGEVFPRWKGQVPDGDGPELGDLSELFPLVRIGRLAAVLPRSLVAPPPSGIACVPVTDAERSRIVIAWREGDDRTSMKAFIRAAIFAHGSARDGATTS